MTRYELISAIAKKAGVSNSEATALFEIFLLKLSDKISLNGFASIDGIGFFHNRKGAAKRSPVVAGAGDEEPEELSLIQFSDKLEEIADQKKNHTFILPKSAVDNFSDIDSHFSMSIKRPVASENIPSGRSSSGQGSGFQTLYGKELKKYLSNKADQLINLTKVVEHKIPDQQQPKPEPSETVEKNFTVVSQDKIQDIAHGLDQEIKPEPETEDQKTKSRKTLQIEKDKQRLESLPWNFGSKFTVKHTDEQEKEKQEPQSPKRIPRDILYERKPEPFRVGKPKPEQKE
ncbi:MAG TPA: HU family DNA-binding protein, partial [Ignavibacteriaceae bacterium]